MCYYVRSWQYLNMKESHRNILKRQHGPSMKPGVCLMIISDHELYVPFNFTFCFRLVKYECSSFKEWISTP